MGLNETARTVATQGVRTFSRGKLAVDHKRATPTGQQLLSVITRCLRDDFTTADREWFNRVEAQRQTLLENSDDLTKLDYGAGASNDSLKETEMASGVVKRTTIADVTRSTSKKAWWAQVLYALIASYQPKVALELGTSVGVSAAYQGGALQRYGGRLVTIEGAPEVAAIAESTVNAVGLDEVVDVLVGRFGDVLPDFLASTEPLNYVFVDGHHDEHATQDYHQMIKPYLAPAAVLVYDDIHWSPGMERAWQAISADPDLCVTVDLGTVGIAILGLDARRSYRYQLPGVA